MTSGLTPLFSAGVDRRTVLGLGLGAACLHPWSVRAVELPAARPDGFLQLEAHAGPALRLQPEPAAATATWSFGGSVPGPLIRVTQGAEVKVRLVNHLDRPTSLHWHGVRIANGMDGVAGLTQPPVPPGGTFDYRFTPPDSGTFWYHPEVAPDGPEQLARGLSGVLIVDEPEPPPVDRDLLAVVGDWRLDAAGQVAGDFADPHDAARVGRIGALVTVNAKPVPDSVTAAPRSRLRLRLVNACNARLLSVRVEGVRPLIIAIDGQPCDPFEPVRQTFPMAPGARYDLMIDLPETAGTAKLVMRGFGDYGIADRDLLVFKAEGEARTARPAFKGLPLNPRLPAEIRLQNAKRVDLVVAGGARRTDPSPAADKAGKGWTINGVASNGRGPKPLFTVRRGTPVVLGFTNRSDFPEAVRLHGHVMRLLHDLDDGWEPYWRDNIIVEPGRTHHAAFLADNPGKWLLRSAIAEHAAAGASTWFEVTG